MVAKPATAYRYAVEPRSIGALAEASIDLWRASWRQTFLPALLYGIAGLLPALTLGDLGAQMLGAAGSLAPRELAVLFPAATDADPDALWQALLAWLAAPLTWTLLLLSLLLSLASLGLIAHRQHALASATDRGWRAAMVAASARVPAALAGWCVYLALMLALSLPIVALTAGVFAWSLQASEPGFLLVLMLLFLVGSLLLSIPLAWASVAFGFAPFASAIDAIGPLRAHRLSQQRVRGHWVHAAIAMTLPLLMYLALGSVASSTVLGLCASVAFAGGGLVALFDSGWWLTAQWLLLAPMAAVLPLATAGVLVAWRDLQLRAVGRESGIGNRESGVENES